MQILRAANYKVMPWKNGLGSTTEIAVSPGAEGLDGFDWRISMARVAADGPFSAFPGIDRTLLVLEGDGIILSVASHPLVRLDRDAIHAFPGDQATYATLVGGPIVDLNIMTRRERFRHAVRRVDLAGVGTWAAPTVLTVVFVERGTISLQAGAVSEVLEERDAILLDAQSPTLRMEAAAPARLVAIEFQPLQPA